MTLLAGMERIQVTLIPPGNEDPIDTSKAEAHVLRLQRAYAFCLMFSLEWIIYVEAKSRKHRDRGLRATPIPLPHSILHVIGPKEQIRASSLQYPPCPPSSHDGLRTSSWIWLALSPCCEH